MSTFLKQIRIFFRLHKNYNKIAKKKSLYFYIYTMPPIGFILSLIVKIFVKTKLKFLINITSHNIFLSTIRYLDPLTREYISKNIKKYNYKSKSVININPNTTLKLNGKNLSFILEELSENGFSNLGTIFSKNQCQEFIKELTNKTCYNSQNQMQSDGIPLNFDPKSTPFNQKKSAYYSFDPSTTLSYKPLNNFAKDTNLKSVIDNYLNFQSVIYNCVTWYNPTSNEEHYVYRSHRDYDDFKFLGMVVYWNDIFENNGPLTFVKKSHRDSNILGPQIKITGRAGTVILVDTFGLHSGSPVKESARYTTTFRYGHYFNMSSVNDGFALTPEIK